MKFLKYAVSLALAAAMTFGGVFAYAEGAQVSDGAVGAGIAQPNTDDTAADDTATDETETPEEKRFDKADSEYSPAELIGYVRWDGVSDFEEDTNYYIDGSAKIGKNQAFSLPKSSRLLICENAQLLIYVGGSLRISGIMTIAPGGDLTASGTFSVQKEGAFESYGTASFTVSSVVNISSKFVVKSGSVTTFSGLVYVYKDGEFIGYGQVTATQNCQISVTGIWQDPESGRLFVKGKLTITLSGRLNMTGYFSLSGELLDSGMIIIGENVKYYKTTNSTITVTKSGRIIDYRNAYENTSSGSYRSGIKGIDVSAWQGVIDWQRVKNAGVQFAMIRSSTSKDKVDKMFEYNITEAQKAGVLVGVYHYCYALTPEEAREEARFFIETISPYRIDYPVMFDFEDNSQIRLGKAMLTEIALAFMDEIDKAGYYGMIYSYKNWLNDNLNMSKLSKYEVAVAEWNVSHSTYSGSYGIWQYSAKGLVSGIEGDVDLDLCYRDYAKIIREGGYNHLTDFSS